MSDVVNAEALGWEEGIHYPSWVDLSQVELNQFFTQLKTAETCYADFLSFLAGKGIDVKDVLFVEPSAGMGAFSSLLPAGSIAMDWAPQDENVEKHDFLTWDAAEDNRITDAKSQGKTIVAIGNPPFGTRGWMALSFLDKCAEFCDYCAFLLPMSFTSEGKGSPKYRVRGMRNVVSKELLKEQFETPDGKTRKLNVVWQIWEYGENARESFEYVDANFVVKCISDFSYRLCGREFKKEVDVLYLRGISLALL